MTQEFITFVYRLIEANPELAKELMTDNIKNCLTISADQKEKPVLTENGKIILDYIQKNLQDKNFRSAAVAAGLKLPPRRISGALRKLVSDGFCDKIGEDPLTYRITEKGKNFIITDNDDNKGE